MMSPISPMAQVDSAKEATLTSIPGVREEFTVPTASPLLVESWLRSRSSLGLPERVTSVPVVSESDLDDSLLEVLHIPMSGFARSLEGTGVGLLLADAQGRILDRWAENIQGLDHLDRVGSVRGAVLAEDSVGTNGLGTAIASERLTQIAANEHYAEFYRSAICTGAPLFHPVTGDLLGAVTLSCDAAPQKELLLALIRTLTASLEKHLLDLEQPGTRQMLDEFLRLSRDSHSPVIGFSAQGLLVQNSAAHQFSPVDFELIQQSALSADSRGRATGETSVGRVNLRIERFPGAGNLLVRVAPDIRPKFSTSLPQLRSVTPLVGKSNEWRTTTREIGRARTTSRPLMVCGEAGSGKTSLAMATPYRPSHPAHGTTVIEAGTLHVLGPRRWFERVEQSLSDHQRLVVRNVDILEQRALEGLRAIISSVSHQNRVSFTVSVQNPRDAQPFALSFGAHLVEAPPLRDHPNDLAALWRYFAELEHPGTTVEPDPTALLALQRYTWPGNLRELQTVVSQILSTRKQGAFPPEELPEAIRNPRTTGLIERAEEEAIRRALMEAGGNRVRAAEILGVSRATVYRKMKTYRLTA